jgi:hypothetical protein
MSADLILAGVMLAALVIYSLLGGADYGAGRVSDRTRLGRPSALFSSRIAEYSWGLGLCGIKCYERRDRRNECIYIIGE